MKRIAHAALLLALAFAPAAFALEPPAADDARTVADITAKLEDFLQNVGEAKTHDAFWAADLVYTSSAGEVTNKAEIMKGFDAPPAAEANAAPAGPPERYTAEDILVRPFGEFAALTFRLVRHAADGTRQEYRNSGMFVRRDGRWQAVTWQATKVPDKEATE